MGYNSEFKGGFLLNKALDDVTFNFLNKLANTRRMARKVDAKYGVQGEFYVDGTGDSGQGREPNVIDFNVAPRTQPGLWCQWVPTEDRRGIEWDGGEKFYAYIQWIEYIISKVLAPRGYVLNGNVKWRGEDFDDTGVIEIHDNMVQGKRLIVDYSINKLLGAVGASTGVKNSTPSVSTNNKRKAGVRPDGTKTKHQIYKEKQEAAKKLLEDQIAKLEADLKAADEELKKKKVAITKKLTVNDVVLDQIRKKAEFGSTLEDFKKTLRNLLED